MTDDELTGDNPWVTYEVNNLWFSRTELIGECSMCVSRIRTVLGPINRRRYGPKIIKVFSEVHKDCNPNRMQQIVDDWVDIEQSGLSAEWRHEEFRRRVLTIIEEGQP